ncbi:unnamed protein product [Rhodiola kirilowii]
MGDLTETLLREVFGESSDEENDSEEFRDADSLSVEDPIEPSDGLSPNWTRIDELPGLWICQDFISAQEQASFLSEIEKEGWFSEASRNQAMRFGNLPQWALELSNYIHEALFFNEHRSSTLDRVSCNGRHHAHSLPLDILRREPLFDQLIVNLYQPANATLLPALFLHELCYNRKVMTQGICAHVDLMRFEDGIAIVSLESPCVMHFTPAEDKVGANTSLSKTKIPIHLTAGSLVLLSGVARYHWKHEINREPGCQIWNGKEINQQRRISITLRKLCPS